MSSDRFASRAAILLVALLLPAAEGSAQSGTAFTYQGRLEDGGAPADGNYEIEFRLFAIESGGLPQVVFAPPAPLLVSDGVFTANVDFGAVFTGGEGWLELGVRVAGNPTYTTLLPRQRVTPAPGAQYAQFAAATGIDSVTGGSVVDGTITAADAETTLATGLQRRVAGACTDPDVSIKQIAADGSVTCETDDVGPAPAPAWLLAGNALIGAGEFLGTTDTRPLELRVNSARVMRYEAGAISPNLIGGHPANAITTGVRGATIAGGGLAPGDSDPNFAFESPNRVTDAYGTIGGGYANRAGNDAGTVLDRPFAHVGGGSSNIASGESATIGGGGGNTAAGFVATIGGGVSNIAAGDGATIGGGGANNVAGRAATVPGGDFNAAGGDYSFAAGRRAKVRTAAQTGEPPACAATATCGDEGSFAWADAQDTDLLTSGPNQFVVRAAGGVSLNAAPPEPDVELAVVGATPFAAADLLLKARDEDWGHQWSSVETGAGPSDSTLYLFHTDTTTSAYAVRLEVNPLGQFAFSRGGLGASHPIHVGLNASTGNGAHLTASGNWTSTSSRTLKTAFAALDTTAVLAGVLELPMQSWSYVGEPGVRHVGPMAEDFRAAFGVGHDERYITMVDGDGVALAAIQGLNAKLESAVRERDERIDALQRRLARLEALVGERRTGPPVHGDVP